MPQTSDDPARVTTETPTMSALVASPATGKPPTPIDPAAYRNAIQAGERRAQSHSDDVDALVNLADLYSLRSAGGPDGPWRLLKGLRPAYDAAAALRSLERARELAPGDPVIAARLRDARVEAAAPMLLAALPKSGSVFVFHGVTNGTGKGRVSGVQGGAFPNFTVCQSGLIVLTEYRLATHTHLAPSRTNLIELSPRFKLDRMHVHVRDPRQALISWFYFMPAVLRSLEPSQGMHYDVPEDYLGWPQPRQLDWQIERFLPWLVDWIAGWLDAPRQPWFKTRILYTSFEEMVADTRAFFDRILAFYEIDPACFTYPETPRVHGDRNFRRGQVDEWRSVLSPEQIERASSAIPARLLDRFGWPQR
jgi:hypothetical protein